MKNNQQMKYAINLNALLPLRAEASEKVEMVTQLLFGEYCKVVEEKESFVKIENHVDQYTGWVDKKMLSFVSPETYQQLIEQPVFRTLVPIADVFCLTNKTIYRLSAGSQLPFFDHEKSTFTICEKTFQIHPSFVCYLPQPNEGNIIAAAMLFQNAPYLWGGKSIFGIDCSGFTQTVYSICGYTIARDASMQAKDGVEIKSLEEAQVSDLLFFEKENKITHVGILLSNNRIIHASGRVRIDKVDEKGIYNEEIQAYTHHLSTIRRIVEI